jgi:hypothetical protein
MVINFDAVSRKVSVNLGIGNSSKMDEATKGQKRSKCEIAPKVVAVAYPIWAQ